MEFSTELNEIFGALAKFRKDVSQPKKDASNPQFRSKYVDLENVTHAIDKVAPKYGLAYTQNVKSNDETVSVQTIITHESGQYMVFDELTLDARPVIKGGGIGRVTAHSTGSAITYGRRFTLSSAFGIASEVDDDGNAASGGEQTQPQQQQQPEPPQQESLQQPTFKEFATGKYNEISALTGWDKNEITLMLEGKVGGTLKGLDQGKLTAVILESLAEIKRDKNSSPALNQALKDTSDKHLVGQAGGNWYE